MKKNLLRAAAAFAGLILGVIIFFPWETLASSLFALAAKEASARGVYVTAASSGVSGLLSKTFSYGGVKADLPAARASLREVGVTPALLPSLLSGEKRAHITFGRGSVVPVTRQPIEWNGGAADVRVTRDRVVIENVTLTGATSVSGSAEISRGEARIVRARLLVKAPPELDRMFEMLRMANMLPLKKIKDGEWRIER